jgi:Zn-finger nucleic acid-binding protein
VAQAAAPAGRRVLSDDGGRRAVDRAARVAPLRYPGQVPYREAPSQPQASRRCPRCQADLGPQALGPNRIERCVSCHGVWIAAAEFNQLMHDLDRLEAVRTRELAHREPEEAVSYLACPRCSEIMERRNFGRSSGIMVDTCKKHGIWLDRGELRRVAEFLAARANTGGALPEPMADPTTDPTMDPRTAGAAARRFAARRIAAERSRAQAEREHGVPIEPRSTLLDALIELLTWPFT